MLLKKLLISFHSSFNIIYLHFILSPFGFLITRCILFTHFNRQLMHINQLKLITLFVTVFGMQGLLKAQESLNSSGENISDKGGTVSYSIGQIVTHTYNSNKGSLAEGVQQAYEISLVSNVSDKKNINLSVMAYPNPTTDYLMLSIDDSDVSGLSYKLYDINGKLIQNETIKANKTKILMNKLIPSSYFVKITHGNIEIRTFKIVKE